MPDSATETQHGQAHIPPWWESELPEVTRELRAYLQRKLPTLHDHHEDILSNTLTALVEQFRRRSDAFPKAWFAPESVVTTEDRAHFHGFAMTILMRRIADMFRTQASEWGRRVAEHDFNKELEPAPTSIERKVLLKQMLQICVEVLASSPEEDRALIAMVTGTGPDVQNALEPSERQRLRRLRLKFAQEISRRLGSSVSVLLREIE